MLQAVLVVVLAVCGWFADPAVSWFADVPSAASVAAYTYDTPHHTDSLSDHPPERGPPSFPGDSTTLDAVDRWLHGASARPGEPAIRVATTYDDLASLVHVARAMGTTSDHAEEIGGDHSSLQRWQVATNTAPNFIASADGVIVSTSRARLEGGLQAAGFPSQATRSPVCSTRCRTALLSGSWSLRDRLLCERPSRMPMEPPSVRSRASRCSHRPALLVQLGGNCRGTSRTWSWGHDQRN